MMTSSFTLQRPMASLSSLPPSVQIGTRHRADMSGLQRLQRNEQLLTAINECRSRKMQVAAAATSPPAGLSGDNQKELDLRKLRTVADFDFWKRHRQSDRYWRHMVGITDSRTVSWVAGPLSWVVLLATGVCLYHSLSEVGLVPEVIPEVRASAGVPFGLTSFALSTLLVLRTNTSYQRWDEARKMWGLMVNRSRDATRQALGYIPAHQPELQDMFCRWMVAYCRSLMCHLRADEDLEKELTGKLRDDELRALMASSHRPNYTCQVLTAIVRLAQLPGGDFDACDPTAAVKASAAFRIDENLTQFADVTGGCERILRTPVPLSYSRHNSRFLIVWLVLLPFTLWESCGWLTVAVTGVVGFLLLAIKEIGVVIEEPFSVLPLERICDTIEANVWEIHAIHSAHAQAEQAAAWRAGNPMAQVDANDLVYSIVPPAEIRNSAGSTGGGASWAEASGTAWEEVSVRA